ncbi:MAG: phosphotransferase [Sulfurimonas sp.]|uniref:aminoglycoside phosphotransferase family protein n=1 Tax=Sulfurimonas sp. TaxID=2022749 RepID=UPI0026373589|nr:phosphotransferase [Sulfurimonas sp.]MCW8896252.1 phosphotransferase [Sulfurimonas sp.]MCW8954604.1 phosphotransferase [Sulfurimonas sp.]MCW9067384.1 phosphotransferase [Sulfurimonas sp.]
MNKIKEWLQTTKYKNHSLEIASADASFRKYYRLTSGDETVLLMDSSLEKESLTSFLDVTQRLLDVHVNAPCILEQNLQDGFLIIKDFGNTHYLDVLDNQNYKSLYLKAINTILKMQKADTSGLPIYDKKFLHVEMDLMKEWYLQKKLNLTLDESQKELITKTLDAISTVVLEQPQDVFVHRDFHSRNIMIANEHDIGVIDYQDAMNGAITYDLVSLLKDCYVAYDRKEIKNLALAFRDKIDLHVDDETFLKWFDFMGMQRHIKVLGIFSRLYLRDGKDGYLKDIPLTLKYVLDTASRYDETKELAEFLKAKC